MFKHFRTTGTLSPTVVGQLSFSVTAPLASGCGSSGSAIHIDFFDASSADPKVVLTYDHETPDGPAWISEVETANSIFAEDCHTFGGIGTSQSGNGQAGITGQNGTWHIPAQTSDNIKIDVNVIWKRTPLTISDLNNTLGANVYPNPSSDDVWIELESADNEQLIITLIDMFGRKVLTQIEFVRQGENELYLNVKGLKAGIYLLELKTSKNSSRLKLKID